MMKRRSSNQPKIDGQSTPTAAAAGATRRGHAVPATRLLGAVLSRPKTVLSIIVVSTVWTFIHNGGIPLVRKSWRELWRNPYMGPYGMVRTPDAPPYQAYLECLKDPKCTQFEKRNKPLVHDYPGHPWHWSRENKPNPKLNNKKDCGGNLYIDLYDHFHQHGYALFESCSLKESNLVEKVADFTKSLKRVDRVQNAQNLAVKEMAIDKDTMEFLEYLHGGRRAFPFQTLNFAKGTQQALHSDLVHFDTSPRTLMSAAWVALEDVTALNGPLRYVPGSHLYGTWDYDEIGLHEKVKLPYEGDGPEQNIYGEVLEQKTKEAGLNIELGDKIKKGQTFVWAAALIHGGSKIEDPKSTRLSQVSHYFFEGADFYWHPLGSDLARGKIDYIGDPTDPVFHRCSSPEYSPHRVHSCADSKIEAWMDNCYLQSMLGVKRKCKAEKKFNT